MTHGFLRIATVAPELRVADIEFNVSIILRDLEKTASQGASIALFPELCLTGYTCGDLFLQHALLDKAKKSLTEIAQSTANTKIHAVVGVPLSIHGRLYNCAAVLGQGRVVAIIPKQFLPNTGEYYEQRWFTSGTDHGVNEIELDGSVIPFGSDLLFADKNSGAIFGVEICEDLWAVQPPSGNLCLSGANLILNPSASNELLGKKNYRRSLVAQQSARTLAAYAYASSGPGESSTDLVFSGHSLIAENGIIISESSRFSLDSQIQCADIDLDRVNHERHNNSSFGTSVSGNKCRPIAINLDHTSANISSGTLRPNPSHPFVPTDPNDRASSCSEIFAIQSYGLAKRIKHTGVSTVVLGISGGLDSTLALLVTVQAFDILGLDRKGILAPTMPGFGTTKRTRGNAENVSAQLGVTPMVIPIHDAVEQHFRDIEHDPEVHDITYENSQARERTQLLMDLANKHGGFVVGTGDLSEAALGWCTFNGDHMSMYHVNIGVPKTLVRYLIEWCAESKFSGSISETLHDIANTPISPELLPVSDTGHQHQETEDVVGPYELHDYFLYHFLRHGSRPEKILYLAEIAFKEKYSRETILRWIEVFFRRFFSQQFKRSAMPDGPKVGSVALSPRGDWRMPSDASAEIWLKEISGLKRSSSHKNS